MTTNPRNDQLILQEGIDYIKIDANEQSILYTLYWIRDHIHEAKHIAANGSNTIKFGFEMKRVVKSKLVHMFGNRLSKFFL
ncbi:hypothetical protein YSY43_12690 [Paenibacillus sp. YSY-4.3]